MKRIITVMFILGMFLLVSCGNSNYYTIIFKDHDDTVILEKKYKDIDDVIYPKVPERIGYSFSKWEKTSNEETKKIYFIAKYIANEYVISFDYENILDLNILYDDTIKLPKPEREGYIFDGWFYNDKLVEDNTFYTFNHSITLSARWSTLFYKIEYYSEGEIIGFKQVKFNQNVKDLLIPKKEHYVFVGWEIEGSIIEPSFIFNYTSDIILNAVWEMKTYNIRLYDDFGLNDNIKVNHGTIVNQIIELEHPDYNFLGWFLDNDKVNIPFIFEYGSDIELEAKWEHKTYNIIFNENGGENLDPLKSIKNEPINYLPIPERIDYVFIGWYINDEKVSIPFVFDFDGDITLEAKWQIKEFDINYNFENMKTTHVYANQVIQELPIPFNPNYKFLGWSLDDEILETPFVYNFDKDLTVEAVWQLKSQTLVLNDNEEYDIDISNFFTYEINKSYEIPINFHEHIHFDIEDELVINYHDKLRTTLDQISIDNNYYFRGLEVNGQLVEGIYYNDKIIFKLDTIKNDFKTLEITPILEQMNDVKIISLYQDKYLSDISYIVDYENKQYQEFKAIKGIEIEILAFEEFINHNETQYIFKQFVSDTGYIFDINNNQTIYKISEGDNLITAIYNVENVLVKIYLTEQEHIYNNQPVSFNGIVINYDPFNFGNTEVYQEPVIEKYLPAGENSIVLITGRKSGVIKSPGLFLLSKQYSILPQNAIINGSYTSPINGKEYNRFLEVNSNYTNIFGENYSEIRFNTNMNKNTIEIKLSFVPVYAVNENGLVDENNNINNIIRNVADFGTFSEAVGFEDSELRNKVNLFNEFKQLEDFKAEHVFGGLGNQPVFLRPAIGLVEVYNYNLGHTYSGLKTNHNPSDLENYNNYSKIENANIFIPLHHDGGDYAIFGKEFGGVSYLNVENTTIVRGAEINSTINNPANYNHYTFNGSKEITEYKLRVGGVSSLTHRLNNIRAVGLNINFGLLYEVNELNQIVSEEKVIAYVGGIAGATGRIGVSRSSIINNNITESEFVGKINLTNVNGIIGGIAGINISGISSSHSSAEIKGYGYIGGIVGENRGVLEGTLFSGSLTVYGVGGGTIGINNPLYLGSNSSSTQIRFNIGGGSTKVLGASDKQFPIWYSSGYSATYNNYAGGFVGVSSLTNFNSNYINNNDARIEGARVSPFFGLIDFSEYRNVRFEIKNNYIVSNDNTIINTDNKNIPALGYWINHSSYTNSNLFSNTVLSVNKTNPNITFESEYVSAGLNANNVLYTQAELTDNFFTSFIDNANANSVSRFVFKPSYTITNLSKYNDMINHQDKNLPFLSYGYKISYELKDEVRVSLAVFEDNRLNYKQLANYTDWTITPVDYDDYYGYYYQTHFQTPNLVFYVTKYTQISFELKRSDNIENQYLLKDYHSFFEYNTPQNTTMVNYDREVVGENNLLLVYNTNSSDYLRQTVVSEISLQIATESNLSSEIYNYSYESGFDVYEEYSFTNAHSYSYEDNFTLTSKNKGILTIGVNINVEKLNSENKNQVTKLNISHKLDIKDLNDLTFNSIDGLEIVVTKTFNDLGFEVLSFNIKSTGTYRVRVTTTSAVRISLEVTGVDETLTGQYVTDTNFRSVALYNHRTDLVDTIENQNLTKTEMILPLTTDNYNDLLHILVTLNNLHEYEWTDYKMVPEYVEVNGDKVFDNEFIFDQSQTSKSNYVHIGTTLTITFAEYLNDIKNNKNGFNIRVNYELIDSFVRVEVPYHAEGTHALDLVTRFINYEINLNANTNGNYIERDNLTAGSKYYRSHNQGATLRLTNLEKLPNNTYTKQDPVTGEYRSYTVANDVYKVVGEERLVRVLLTASPIYRNYNFYVQANGENPEDGLHDFKFTTDLIISVNEFTSREFYFGINIYEVYEVEINTDLSKNSFGTLKELTPENMPIASLQGNLSESVEFKKVNNTTLLNAFATLNNVARTDNKQFLLAEYGSRIKATSSRDNITDQLQLERLEFERWNSGGAEIEDLDRLDEEFLYGGPLNRNEVYTAEYKFKTVKVYIRSSIVLSTHNGLFEPELPKIVPANPDLANDLVLNSRMEGVYEVAEYLYNGKVIAKSDPSRIWGLRDDPIIIPLEYEHQGEQLYDVKSRYRAIDITYGEELEFVVKDYSIYNEAKFDNIKTGEFKLFTFLEEKGHEDYYTSLKQSDPADTHINKLALLDGDAHWIQNNSETGATIKVRGQVLGEFVINSEILPVRRNQFGYNIDHYDGANIHSRKHTIVRYSNPILNSSVVANYETLINAYDFSAYKYSNIEIMFNLTAIAQEHNIKITDFDWMFVMNENYAGDGTPTIRLITERINHIVGEADKVTRAQHMNFYTSTQIIDGDLYAVINYNLSVHESVIFTLENAVWSHNLSEQMFTTLIINPKDSNKD